MKAPKEAIEAHLVAERDLQSQRKLKVAEARLKIESAKLSASEKQVAELEEKVSLLSGLQGVKPKKLRISGKGKPGNATAVVLLSDFHCEEPVDPKKVNGLNEYSMDIADSSIKETFQRTLKLLQHERGLVNIKDMVIWLGGDFLSGAIHPELIETAGLAPLATCRWVSQRLQDGIQFLLDNGDLDKITIVTSFGNHGRTTDKRRIATGSDNSYEYHMYRMMEGTIHDDRLFWQIGEGYHNYIDIQGHLCRFHHGDAMRYHGAIGGITTTVEKAIRAWNHEMHADYTFSGHFHTFRAAPHWVSNGSLIGYSPFGIEIKCEFEEPSQTFCVIDKDRGMTVVKKIFCRPPYRKTKP